MKFHSKKYSSAELIGHYKYGDLIYLTEEYCEFHRIPNQAWEIIDHKYTRKTYETPLTLTAYTVRYGAGGHDVYLHEIDYVRTQREVILNQILN